jgi:predicted enzyme related to lactoylglutathione lyase
MNPTPINYIELYSTDLIKTKAFYSAHFGWEFTDYGDGYSAFSKAGIDGGFELVEKKVGKGTLVVLYHKDLEAIHNQLLEAGMNITVPIFAFPGGRRFHFEDPTGNELAIWSE